MKGTVTCMHQLDCKNSCKFAAETKEICVLIIRKNFICRNYAIKDPTVHGFKKLCFNHSTKKGLIPRAIMQSQAGTELQIPQLCSQKKTVSEVKMQRA